MLPGVYRAEKKDKTTYYRSSITFKNKHISLGSFSTEKAANLCYLEAQRFLTNKHCNLETHSKYLSFKKKVSILNFRDNGIYSKTPIYMYRKFFHYYFGRDDYYIFDIDDLFYYSNHSIMRRGGHLFVNDYGMQVNILSRYGIKNYGVPGRDFNFVNNNNRDFRYENIQIINRFNGVFKKNVDGKTVYETVINITNDFIVGRYTSESVAAIAYNRAASILILKGYEKKYSVNYIEDLTKDEYKKIFDNVDISPKILALPPIN
ncbi:MAG: hypothetical protein K6G63_06210 [Eubacterium sp.]|nr:hypothetical protein [Eubacterium sp.]